MDGSPDTYQVACETRSEAKRDGRLNHLDVSGRMMGWTLAAPERESAALYALVPLVPLCILFWSLWSPLTLGRSTGIYLL